MATVTTETEDVPYFLMRRPSARGEPAWDIATLFPAQGEWSEQDYFGLKTRHLVEFSDGHIEVLPMQKLSHQRMALWLLERLNEFVRPRQLGEVLFAPVPVRLWPRKYREPDLFFLSRARLAKAGEYPDGVDLAVEVVSDGPEARERDLETKRVEYAAAGIPEYWIVDPELQQITVLTLVGTAYQVHGVFAAGTTATSVLLEGFNVVVADVFAAGAGPAPAE